MVTVQATDIWSLHLFKWTFKANNWLYNEENKVQRKIYDKYFKKLIFWHNNDYSQILQTGKSYCMNSKQWSTFHGIPSGKKILAGSYFGTFDWLAQKLRKYANDNSHQNMFFFGSAKIHSCQIDPFEVLSSTNQFKYFVFFSMRLLNWKLVTLGIRQN